MGRASGGKGGATPAATRRGGSSSAAVKYPSSPAPRRVSPYRGRKFRSATAYQRSRGPQMGRYAAPDVDPLENSFGEDWLDADGRKAAVRWQGSGEIIAEFADSKEVEIIGYVGSKEDSDAVLSGHEDIAAAADEGNLNWVRSRVHAYVRANQDSWDESQPLSVNRDQPVMVSASGDSASSGASKDPFASLMGGGRGLS